MITDNLHCKHYDWFIGSILLVKDHAYRIKEIPIVFINRVHGKSKLKTTDVLSWGTYIGKAFFKRFLSVS